MKMQRMASMLIALTLIAAMLCWNMAPVQAAEVKSGFCGEDLTWTLDDNGTLTISGTGEMADYDISKRPWYAYRADIRTVVIEENVTSIGNEAFSGCAYLTRVELPATLTEIGFAAFKSCWSLWDISIPDSVIHVEQDAFGDCENLVYHTYNSAIYLGNANNPYLVLIEYDEFYDENTSCAVHSDTKVIADYAFSEHENLEEIHLPEGLRSIGDMAFYYCERLSDITIPDSVQRVDAGFANCDNLWFYEYENGKYLGNWDNPYLVLIGPTDYNLRYINIHENTKVIAGNAFAHCTKMNGTITIPAGVVSIGENAFSQCTGVDAIQVDADNPYYSNDEAGVLFNKSKTVLLQAPGGLSGAYAIANGVTQIGRAAFAGCAYLTDVTIPNTVTAISSTAFSGCKNLTAVTIPNTVTWIGNTAFSNCGISSIVIPDSVTWVDGNAFSGCSNLKDVVFGKNVRVISERMFFDCNNLKQITIPDHVTHIEAEAFRYCRNLTSVTFERNSQLVSIGAGAFSVCTSLTDFPIPDGVEYLGYNVLGSCSNLTSITIPNSVTDVEGPVCDGCEKLVLNTYGTADYLGNEENPYLILVRGNDTAMTTCTIHENTKIIGYAAFNDCTSLTEITIPDSVFRICDNAFYDCRALTSVTIGTGVTNVGYYAFSTYYDLNSIHIPSIEAWCQIDFEFANPLGENAKLYCSGELVTDVVIPEGITRIGDYAFSNCSTLTNITLPESLTEIGIGAFENCDSLADIVIPSGVTSIDMYTFHGCKSLTAVTLPEGLKHIDQQAFSGCAQLVEIVVPDSVTTIGPGAFRYCESLINVTMGKGVTFIGYQAFLPLDKLWHVLYRGTEDQWNAIWIAGGNDALENAKRHYECTGMEIIDLENKVCVLCCDHDSVATDIVDPTCNTQGYTNYVCSICGHSERDDYVPANSNHDYVAIEVIAPTCAKQGYTRYCCSVCGDEKNDDIVPATGKHDYVASEVYAPTCTTQGYTEYSCAVCGHICENDFVDALGHDYVAVVTEPTCTEKGYTTYTCSRCGDTYKDNYVNSAEHSYTAVVTEPTCTEKGYTTYTCTGCGHSEKGDYTDPLGHIELIDPGKEATCTQSGLTEGKHCSRCGAVLVAQQILTAKGHKDANGDFVCDVCGVKLCTSHTEEVISGKEPTCEESGLTEGKYCGTCGEILQAQDVIPAKGHQWQDATCETPKICAVCGKTEGEARDHSFGEWIVVKEPTTEETGLEERVCSECGKTEQNVLEKLEPAPTEPTTAPTEPTTVPMEPTSAPTRPAPTVPATTAPIQVPKEDDPNPMLWIILIVVVLAAAVVAIMVLKKKKK